MQITNKFFTIIFFYLILVNYLTAQNVGINSTGALAHSSALLDVDAAPANATGFLMPRITNTQRKSITLPATGLMVYDLTLKGIYIFDGAKWDCAQIPAGTVNYFANITPPNGFLECAGQAVSRTTYAELFNAIGTLYGTGDGSTTFNVPDLRGEFVRGFDNGRGVDAGRVIGTAQADNIKSHNHSIDPPNTVTDAQGTHNHPISTWDVSTTASFIINDHSGDNIVSSDNTPAGTGEPKINRYYSDNAGNHQHNLDISSFNSANTGGTETRPRNVALMACIKF